MADETNCSGCGERLPDLPAGAEPAKFVEPNTGRVTYQYGNTAVHQCADGTCG
jgi:hypothetical protein